MNEIEQVPLIEFCLSSETPWNNCVSHCVNACVFKCQKFMFLVVLQIVQILELPCFSYL